MRNLLIIVVGALLALAGVTTPVAGATTVSFADGATFGARPDRTGFNERFLGGAYQDATFSFLDYPASVWPITGLFAPTLGTSVDIGTANLIAFVRDTPGPKVVSGASEGALVVQQAQAALDADPSIGSDTTFFVIASPNLGIASGLHGWRLPILDYTPQPLAQTRFTTVVVTNQYDLIGDPIARPWNVLTVANAVMALAYVHPYAQDSDLSTVPPENITTTVNDKGGTTTSYFVPTRQLPLTMPLRQLGVPGSVVDGIDGVLRPVIDAGYAPVGCPMRRPAATRPTASAARPAGSSSRSGATGTSGRHSPAR